jgi:hypothetical protein
MSLIRDMAVVWRSTGDLSPHPHNPRTHNEAQIEQLFSSVQRFGWTCPLIVDEDLTILAGHGRWQMADLNNIQMVPTIQVLGLSDEEKRAYLIADNRLSENADWDIPALLGELDWLSGHAIEADMLGFSDADMLAMHASIDDAGDFSDPDPAPRGGGRITSSTEPTQLQEDADGYTRPVETAGGPSVDVAATLVPFSLMMPLADRERVIAVLNGIRGDGTMADALMLVINASGFEPDERTDDDGQDG